MTRREILLQEFIMGYALEYDYKCSILHRCLADFYWGWLVPITETKADIYFIYDIYNT